MCCTQDLAKTAVCSVHAIVNKAMDEEFAALKIKKKQHNFTSFIKMKSNYIFYRLCRYLAFIRLTLWTRRVLGKDRE